MMNNAVVLQAQGYETLARILGDAFDQAARGKGAARHANGKSFDTQPMQELISLYGQGFALGQAAKKSEESQRLDYAAARRELLGAIVYTAGAILYLDAHQPKGAEAPAPAAPPALPPLPDMADVPLPPQIQLPGGYMPCAGGVMLFSQACEVAGL